MNRLGLRRDTFYRLTASDIPAMHWASPGHPVTEPPGCFTVGGGIRST